MIQIFDSTDTTPYTLIDTCGRKITIGETGTPGEIALRVYANDTSEVILNEVLYKGETIPDTSKDSNSPQIFRICIQ